jgi:Zn finger protein HypA/HybF involved in hydrogenase expression
METLHSFRTSPLSLIRFYKHGTHIDCCGEKMQTISISRYARCDICLQLVKTEVKKFILCPTCGKKVGLYSLKRKK